ncbi:MAG TPA: hypothetical protein VHA52_07505, partial [Candidatus Babeliaceae bacterium]|nr:hypothetical protein [Candidatus Babeliaceae bacterium]
SCVYIYHVIRQKCNWSENKRQFVAPREQEAEYSQLFYTNGTQNSLRDLNNNFCENVAACGLNDRLENSDPRYRIWLSPDLKGHNYDPIMIPIGENFLYLLFSPQYKDSL